MNFSFILFALFRPLRNYLGSVYTMIKLKYKNPTLKLAGTVAVSKTTFSNYNYISKNVTLTNVKIGDFSYVGANTFMQNVQIGKFTCIGPDVKIGLGEHPSNTFISIHPIFYSMQKQVGISFSDKSYFDEYKNTNIGNDVWIGSNVVIMGGVKIGDGAIIASGAIVTKDVLPYDIVGGVPAKVLRKRFSENQIEEIIHLKWWDQDISWLKQNFQLMHNIENVNTLIKNK